MITPLFVLAALLLHVVNFGLNTFALLLHADLQSDYVNPYQFVERLGPRLRLEAALHAPLLLCWACAGGMVPLLLTLALVALRWRWWLSKTLLLDVTSVFAPAEQRRRWWRWAGGAGAHALGGVIALFRFFYLVPLIDMDRMREAQERHHAMQEELRERVASGNASLSQLMAAHMSHPGLFPGAML